MENENTIVQCTQNKASIPRTKSIWDADSISKLCDLCVKEVEGGHRLGMHFLKVGWENLVKNFSNALKTNWKIWKQLISKETGLGWNTKKRTVDASDEWWESKLQVVPNAAKFRKEGITLDMVETLDKMFMNIIATGESNQKRPNEETEKEVQKSKWAIKKNLTSGATKLVQQVDHLIDVVKECDIPQVIDVLDSLPGLEIGSELYFFATQMFFVKEKRVMFMSMKQSDLKLNWLKYHYGLGSSS
ncbi:hypothetical protein UlMin_041886 [Ulmus minor]